jgi:hypothetical protein
MRNEYAKCPDMQVITAVTTKSMSVFPCSPGELPRHFFLRSWLRIELEPWVCLCLFFVCVVLCRSRSWDGLIPRLRSPTDCKGYKTEEKWHAPHLLHRDLQKLNKYESISSLPGYKQYKHDIQTVRKCTGRKSIALVTCTYRDTR